MHTTYLASERTGLVVEKRGHWGGWGVGGGRRADPDDGPASDGMGELSDINNKCVTTT